MKARELLLALDWIAGGIDVDENLFRHSIPTLNKGIHRHNVYM